MKKKKFSFKFGLKAARLRIFEQLLVFFGLASIEEQKYKNDYKGLLRQTSKDWEAGSGPRQPLVFQSDIVSFFGLKNNIVESFGLLKFMATWEVVQIQRSGFCEFPASSNIS